MEASKQTDELSSIRAMVSELEVDVAAARAALHEAQAELAHAERKHDLISQLLRSMEG
jgi:outer membrane murein-binding lipoprotein Lpp